MEIRDVIHGGIPIRRYELPIVDSRQFQRLRQIKQMGFADHSFPNATHTRYTHSLGAMHVASKAIRSALFDASVPRSPAVSDVGSPKVRLPKGFDRLEAALRLAALLHDVGHGPLSHTTEFAMPDVRRLAVPLLGATKGRQATHEDYTLKIILDSSLTPHLVNAGKPFGFGPQHIAALVSPEIDPKDDFFFERVDGTPIDFQPILHQLVSSELDADRMDYLRRDSLYSGVSYGQFDFDWIVGHLTSHIERKRCFLGFEHRALYAFEDFLISRYHMFLMVYFHHKSVVYDEMLKRYLASGNCEYTLPADIEKYNECNDSHLNAHLEKSRNEWARRVCDKKPYRMLVELHTGIPATKTADQEQGRLRARIRRDLETMGVDFVETTSTSELSKYVGKPRDPIFVRYDNNYSAPNFIPVEKCTDLFERYAEKRTIIRLYVSPEDYPRCRPQGRDVPLRYEEDLLRRPL